MKYLIKSDNIVIYTDNYCVELPKQEFYNKILTEAILTELSFDDLQIIWKNLYGFPGDLNKVLKQKIELYSSSSNINSFIYKGKEYWLDKSNRACLLNISKSSLGNIEFILGDEVVNISPSALTSFLINLEGYAHKCFVNTFKHLQAIKGLYKPEDIFNYDYTTGYPDKITLE